MKTKGFWNPEGPPRSPNTYENKGGLAFPRHLRTPKNLVKTLDPPWPPRSQNTCENIELWNPSAPDESENLRKHRVLEPPGHLRSQKTD